MAAGDLGDLKFRGDNDQPMGEKLMEVALGLMRQVNEGLQRMEVRQGRMEDSLKDLADQRREEARADGEISARVRTLEQALPRDARARLEALEDSHKAVRGIVYFIAGSLILAGLLWLFSHGSRIDAIPPK